MCRWLLLLHLTRCRRSVRQKDVDLDRNTHVSYCSAKTTTCFNDEKNIEFWKTEIKEDKYQEGKLSWNASWPAQLGFVVGSIYSVANLEVSRIKVSVATWYGAIPGVLVSVVVGLMNVDKWNNLWLAFGRSVWEWDKLNPVTIAVKMSWLVLH